MAKLIDETEIRNQIKTFYNYETTLKQKIKLKD